MSAIKHHHHHTIEANQRPKERPMLFSGDMVRAILEGRKTQTRRSIKVAPEAEFASQMQSICTPFRNKKVYILGGEIKSIICPYGQPGDHLWVRETWNKFGNQYAYAATDSDVFSETKWLPSIHMPRSAARILLQITDIRAERLYDITDADAIAEGIEQWPDGNYKAYGKHAGKYTYARHSFLDLFQHVTGIDTRTQNPWVWVITFKKV